MSKEGIVKKAGRWETHHRIAAFCAVVIGAIVVTRLGVAVYFPGHAVVLGTELHHFDYGLVLLLISSQLSLFGPKKLRDLYIFLTAISSGLILDEYWMIRHGVEHAPTRVQKYNSPIPSPPLPSMIFLFATL